MHLRMAAHCSRPVRCARCTSCTIGLSVRADSLPARSTQIAQRPQSAMGQWESDVNKLHQQLQDMFEDRAVFNADVREQHGRDESFHAPSPPDVVVYAKSTEEVAAVVRECARNETPLIPFGVGTSLEGHVAALQGGVCLDLSRRNVAFERRTDMLNWPGTVSSSPSIRALMPPLAGWRRPAHRAPTRSATAR